MRFLTKSPLRHLFTTHRAVCTSFRVFNMHSVFRAAFDSQGLPVSTPYVSTIDIGKLLSLRRQGEEHPPRNISLLLGLYEPAIGLE